MLMGENRTQTLLRDVQAAHIHKHVRFRVEIGGRRDGSPTRVVREGCMEEVALVPGLEGWFFDTWR